MGNVFSSLRSLLFLEIGRIGIANQTQAYRPVVRGLIIAESDHVASQKITNSFK